MSWIGSAVTLSSDEMDYVRGVVVDVIYSQSRFEITHAIVAIDLGDDFPTVYQPIRLGLLRAKTEPNTFSVQGSRDAIAEVLPEFVEYETNVARAGSRALAPFPRSSRIH
jgi:hypothetical protein